MTGVQTCALPIFAWAGLLGQESVGVRRNTQPCKGVKVRKLTITPCCRWVFAQVYGVGGFRLTGNRLTVGGFFGFATYLATGQCPVGRTSKLRFGRQGNVPATDRSTASAGQFAARLCFCLVSALLVSVAWAGHLGQETD